MICSQQTQSIPHDILPSIEFRSHQLFIETPEPWNKVYSLSSHLPKDLLPVLQDFAKHYPHSSVSLFAPDSDYSDSTRLRIVFLRQNKINSQHERFEYLIPYETLTAVLSQILFSEQRHKEYSVPITSERDYFICTHTNRDACCGKWGNELYESLKKDMDLKKQNIRIFKCSHIGGHRYAPTMLEAPDLNCWGQLNFNVAKDVLLRSGDLSSLVSHYRGSARLNSHYFQVAEREMMKIYGWDFLKRDVSYFLKEDASKNFAEVKGEELKTFEIEKVEAVLLRANCNEEKMSFFPQYKIKST